MDNDNRVERICKHCKFWDGYVNWNGMDSPGHVK